MKTLYLVIGNVCVPDRGDTVKLPILSKIFEENDIGCEFIQFFQEVKCHKYRSVKTYRNPFFTFASEFYGLLQNFGGFMKNDIIFVTSPQHIFYALAVKMLGKILVYDVGGYTVQLTDRDAPRLGESSLRNSIYCFVDHFITSISTYVIVCNQFDYDYAKTVLNVDTANLFLVPPAVKIPEFDNHGVPGSIDIQLDLNPRNTVALFVGELSYSGNREAVEILITKIALATPNITFLVVGRGSDTIRNEPHNVILTGFVEDLDRIYEISDLCVVPLISGKGVKTKILEGLAHGKPIITTKFGIEGLDSPQEILENGLYVREIDQFAETLISIDWKNVDGKGLLQYAKSHYSEECYRNSIKPVILSLKFNSGNINTR